MRIRAPAAALLVASTSVAYGWDIDTSTDDVDVLYESRPLDQSVGGKPPDQPGDAEEDANYEYDYEVHNRRSEPILFTTSVTECENCRSELKTSVRIEPDQTVGIGSMVRVDQSKTWKFNFNTDWTDAEGGGDPSSNQQPGQDNPH